MINKPDIDHDRIAEFCRKWLIREFSLFGSILRDDFGPDSDIDVLVSLQPNTPWSLWDWITMRDELRELFGRDVDMVEQCGLKNPFRRHAILSSRKMIYAAES